MTIDDTTGAESFDHTTWEPIPEEAMEMARRIRDLCDSGNDGTGDRFKFQLDVITAPIWGNWIAPTGTPFTTEVTMVADLSNSHMLEEIADIPAANTTVSTIYSCKFTRIAATVDEYGSEIYVKFNDSHYGKDDIGSRNEDGK